MLMNPTPKISIRYFSDRLYGRVEFTAQDLKLYQTPELSRLRQVSLSAIPTWTQPVGICADKFEHSIGVAHLARLVGAKTEFQPIAVDLYLAALLHDIGTPPFSHASEIYQQKKYQVNHEQFAARVINNSNQLKKLIKSAGGNIKTIIQFITGQKPPFSDLVNGSIDLDNLDNSLRFSVSMGLIDHLLYSPESLAQSLSWDGRQLYLGAYQYKNILGWETCRRHAYAYVYSTANLASGTMLLRGLEFAYRENKLDDAYFLTTDAQAFDYLRFNCNQQTKTIMDRLYHWHHYRQIYRFETDHPSPTLKRLITNYDNRDKLADQIARQHQLPPEDICVFLGINKGYKRIHLPILTPTGRITHHHPHQRLTYLIQIYLHPRHFQKTAKSIVDQLTAELPLS